MTVGNKIGEAIGLRLPSGEGGIETACRLVGSSEVWPAFVFPPGKSGLKRGRRLGHWWVLWAAFVFPPGKAGLKRYKVIMSNTVKAAPSSSLREGGIETRRSTTWLQHRGQHLRLPSGEGGIETLS